MIYFRAIETLPINYGRAIIQLLIELSASYWSVNDELTTYFRRQAVDELLSTYWLDLDEVSTSYRNAIDYLSTSFKEIYKTSTSYCRPID